MGRVRRFFFLGVRVLLGVEIVWLLLGNGILSTDLGRLAVNFKPEKFVIEWDKAWTLYPAHIQGKGVTIRINTWKSATTILCERVEGNIRLLPLFSRHLLFDQLRTDGVTVKVDRKYPEGERPVPKKKTPGFLVELRDLEVENFEEFSFDQISVAGGTATGTVSMKVQIRGRAEVQDARVSWRDAAITLDEAEFAESLSLSFRGGLASFLPKEDKGKALIAKLSGQIDLGGNVGSLTPIKFLFPAVDWVERIDGQGQVSAHINLVDGWANTGSTLAVVADGLQLDFLGFSVRGSGTIDGSIGSDSTGSDGVVKLTFDQYSLARQGDSIPLANGSGLSLSGKSAKIGVVNSIDDLGLELILDMPDSEVPDISFLGRSLPEELGVSINQGRATLKGRMVVSGTQTAAGTFELRGENLSGRFRDMGFTADMALTSKVSGNRLNDFSVDLKGTEFKIFNGIFDNQTVAVDPDWWMSISIPKGHADLGKPVTVEADAALAMKDTRAIIAMFAEVKDWVRYFDGVLTINDVSGSARIKAGDKRARIQGLELTGDKLGLMAELELENDSNNGIFWGKFGAVSLGLEKIGNKRDWKFINSRKWYQKKKIKNWAE